MKAPARVLIVSILVALAVIFVVMYRYHILPGSFQKLFEEGSQEASLSTLLPKDHGTDSPDVSATPTPSPSLEQLARGKQLYETATCALCHGMNGKADSPTGRAVHAADLTTGIYKHKAQSSNESYILYLMHVIREGIPNTGMSGFKTQIPDEKDQEALAHYVYSLREKK